MRTIPRLTTIPALLLILFALVPREAVSQQPGTVRWRVKIADTLQGYGQTISAPAIAADGTVYIGSGVYGTDNHITNNLYAISPLGQTNWIFSVGPSVGLSDGDIRSSAAIAADGMIYIGSFDGNLYSITPSGMTNWAFGTFGQVRSSPALAADGTIYVGSTSNLNVSYTTRLYSVHPDGRLNWMLDFGVAPYGGGSAQFSSPCIGPDGTIYIGSLNSNLYAVNPSGTVTWKAPLGSRTESSPAIGPDGTIYIGCDDLKLYAFDRLGRKKWEFLTGYYVESSPAVSIDGTVYFGSLDGNLYALDPSGAQKWGVPLGAYVSGSPALGADGTIYSVSATITASQLYALSPSGTTGWSLSLGQTFSSPTVAPDGTIYIAAGAYLYAIYGSTPLQQSAWPMFRHDPKHTARSTQRGISAPTVLPDGRFRMSLTTEIGLSYRVQSSTDLAAWADLSNFVSESAACQFIDSRATDFARRFYRLVSP